MRDFLARLARFMEGRHGSDSFNRFLFALSVVFWIVGFINGRILSRFIPGAYTVYLLAYVLNLALYGFALFRFFSRNNARRVRENEWYLRMRDRVAPFMAGRTASGGYSSGDAAGMKDTANYLYKKCPSCGCKLRLKRIKGKHKSQCPKCGRKFTVRVFRGRKNYEPYN